MESLTLPIHFGNPQGTHEISSDSLLLLIASYKEICEFFGVSVSIRIGIPAEGGWRANLLIAISLLGANPFIALLTGNTADEWAKIGHEKIILKVNEFLTTEAAKLPEQLPIACIKSKNKVYQQFQNDGCIDSFKIGDFPPIPRNNFYLYIKEIPDEEHIYLGEADITVSSPDWKGKRPWRGNLELIEGNEISFAFDKDLTGKFWEKVKIDGLPLHTTDIMRVQLVQRPTNKVKYLVIRVLRYNDEVIDTLLSEDAISRAYGADASITVEGQRQLDLL